ncbi:MAG: transcriptional repressor [Deltaproteobacteria bacterium]|nr:transcriptional repressor [Deltaproteobacteria bacterium]
MNKEVFKSVFQNNRVRMSHPRLFIYQELAASNNPLSPQELYRNLIKQKKKIGLTSIYRSLDLFESLGVVFKIVNGSNVKYKICEMDDHHHHIVCKKCGEVVELHFCHISDWSEKVKESTGYEVTDHHLNFYGFCKNCKSLQT